MAGGTGQRCWPLSRKARPKQFHDFLGQGKSLLQATAERFEHIIPQANMWVVTQAPYAEEVKKQLPFLKEAQLLCEPTAKHTAPCIAYAGYKIAAKYPHAQVVITPADHTVEQVVLFTQAIEEALRATASADHLAILGVHATNPATGYGYVTFEEQEGTIKQVREFVEKPSLEQAKTYLSRGNYAWHTGIVVGYVATLLRQYQAHLPALWRGFEQGKALLNTCQEQAFIETLYQSLALVSFDHGILEKVTNLFLIRCTDIGWSDIGTWKGLYESMEKDQQGNAIQGRVTALATKNCMIRSTGDTLVATYGIENLTIVQHGQVVMVCPKDQEQQVKQLVEHLAAQGQEAYL
ncbi:MAG: sugar phosphate nucleotidyltransferase [Bacteroidota bacterium]